MERITTRLLLASLCLGMLSVGTMATGSPDAACDVLFLGNSYTSYNDLPGLIQGLAQSAGHSLYRDQNTPGGHRLAEHAVNPISLAKISAHPWDFVVLQEFSLIPVIDSLRVNSMYPAARLLDGLIHDNGSQTLFFMTWGREFGGRYNLDGYWSPDFPDFFSMQVVVSAAYREIGAELDAPVAPVGDAWALAKTLDPGAPLWHTDHTHPSLHGSYLAACVFYIALYEQSPIGLPFTGGLTPDRALFYQQVAEGAVTGLHEASTSISLAPVRFVSVSPNPFNPATTIEFELAVAAEIRLEIVDVSGRLVATLVAGPHAAGRHTAFWAAADWPSAVFFCRLTTGPYVATRKLTLAR